VDPTAFHIQDGSGLSPQNRVTAFGLVQVLEFARTKPWFKAFNDALPIIDGISMKSGSIGGARGYTGYVGNYTFAFLINNYDGSGTEVQHKMWKVLDQLK
jgi:D-alanyl-D-alanine carboxypeptidase/D-alanyl-D-alanine-endopeptidase (penicillin-binding protein 4)